MEEKENIELRIADTVIDRPFGFRIGEHNLFIYSPTLGKTYMLARLFKELHISGDLSQSDPYIEALRLCDTKNDVVCQLLAYCTFDSKDELFDNTRIKERSELLKELSNEELSTLFVLVLSYDSTDEFVQYLGINKDREERRRISENKKDSSSITFGGRSIYGTLIDFACQRYGWTMEYVLWGISYANLKMLMADAVTTIYLSDEERKNLHIFDNKEYINADDPKNKELVRELLSE